MDKIVFDLLNTLTFDEVEQQLDILVKVRKGLPEGKYRNVEGVVHHGLCYCISREIRCGKAPVLFTHDIARKYGGALQDSEYFWWPTNLNWRTLKSNGSPLRSADSEYYDLDSRLKFLDWMICQYRLHQINLTMLGQPLSRFKEVLTEVAGLETLERFKIALIQQFKGSPTEFSEKVQTLVTSPSFSYNILSAFVWSETTEGTTFWSGILSAMEKYDRLIREQLETFPTTFRHWLDLQEPHIKLAFLHSRYKSRQYLDSSSTFQSPVENAKDIFMSAFVWGSTPEKHDFWKKKSEEWVAFLQSQISPTTISLDSFRKIHDIACGDWKKILESMATRRMDSPTSEFITLTSEDITSMFEAATNNQKKVLRSIFKGIDY